MEGRTREGIRYQHPEGIFHQATLSLGIHILQIEN